MNAKFSWERWGHRGVEAVDALFIRPNVLKLIGRELAIAICGPLAKPLQVFLRYPEIDQQLPYLAEHAANPAVRGVAMRALLAFEVRYQVGFHKKWTNKVYGFYKMEPKMESRQLTISTDVPKLIARALCSKSVMVRRVAADAVMARRAELTDLKSYARIMLSDGNNSIRERGKWLEKKLESPPESR